MAITDRDRKILWGRAANRCAVCRCVLVHDADDMGDPLSVVGEECHIIGAKIDGPRGAMTRPERIDGYDNLILLCATHHKQVDDQPEHYSIERLRQIKSQHESLVATRLEEHTLPSMRWIIPKDTQVQLELATNGTELLHHVVDCLAYAFDHDEPRTTEDAEMIGALLQDLADYGDMWSEIGPAAQVKERFDMTHRVSELLVRGYATFVGRETRYLEINGNRDPWPIAVVAIRRIPDEVLQQVHDQSGTEQPDAS